MIEIVYEVRIKLSDEPPPEVQIIDEAGLMSAVLHAARQAEGDDDYRIRIVGVEVELIS